MKVPFGFCHIQRLLFLLEGSFLVLKFLNVGDLRVKRYNWLYVRTTLVQGWNVTKIVEELRVSETTLLGATIIVYTKKKKNRKT